MKVTTISRTAFVLTIAVSTMGTACQAQDTPPPPPLDAKTYTLEAKHTVNEALKYKMSMKMKMDMKAAKTDAALPKLGDITMDMTMRLKTVAVKPDGTGVIVMQVLDGESTAMGQKRSMAGTPPITQEVDKRGKVVSMKGMEALPGAQFMQGMDFKNMGVTGLILPDHPVRVGDTWETEQAFPLGDSKGKVTCTILGTESIQGQETLKIKQIWAVPLNMNMGMDGKPTKDEANAMIGMTGNVTISSLANILPANARAVKTVADVDMKLIMSMKGAAAAQSPFGETMEMTSKGKTELALLSAEIVTPPAAKPSSSLKKPAAKSAAAKKH